MSKLETNETTPSGQPAPSIAEKASANGRTSPDGFAVSPAIWGRIGLLLGALCLIKVLLLVSFQKHLYEIHWRIGGIPFGWINHLAFWLFVGLAGVNLWVFAARCEKRGLPAVRGANTCLLAISALLILLTFHEGDKNYFYPVIHGFLSWADLKWYLALNFFFRPPYLALWIAGYGLIYYALARKKREHLILRVTALFACAYLGLCLREWMVYRTELLLLNCLGIACLVGAIRGGELRWWWMGVLGGWLFFFFFLFGSLDPAAGLLSLRPEFAIYVWGSVIIFAGISAVAWRRGFLREWKWLLPFSFVAFLLFSNTNHGWAANYNNLLCMGLALPRYFLAEFALAATLFAMAVLYRKWRPTGTLVWLDAAILILVITALVDLRLAQIMGARLEWNLLSLAFGETPKMMWRMARPYLPAVLVVMTVILGGYWFLLRLIKRNCPVASVSAASEAAGIGFLVLAFVLLGTVGDYFMKNDKGKSHAAYLLAVTSPLGKAVAPVMEAGEFARTADELGIWPKMLPETKPAAPRDLNVVLIFQESTFNRHLSLFGGTNETQPLLSKYRDRMELFPNFFASFASSIHARFATFSGLYPVRDFNAFTLRSVPVKSIFEILAEYGYASSIFYSSSYDYTGFRDFLRGRGVKEMYDADSMPGERLLPRVSWGLREEETLRAMREYLKKSAAEDRKFFMSYIPAAPHYPFDGVPSQFKKYRLDKMGDFTPAYLNELLYMDWVIASILDELRDTGLLEKTLVIITSDHGELLGEDSGPIGHGWMITPELSNVPLIIMDPARRDQGVNQTIGSQVDLLPTILDLLGIPTPSDQLYQGVSLYSSLAQPDRKIYINSYSQYAVISNGEFIWGERASDSPGRLGNSAKSFAITNDGPRTLFIPLEESKAGSISGFDRFQESLLHNFAHYRELVKNTLVHGEQEGSTAKK